MILADENIEDYLIDTLLAEGFEVFSIKRELRGMQDLDIADYSLQPPRIILTEDKDFGDIVFANKKKLCGVILLRYHFSETQTINGILLKFLKENKHNLLGNFITISVNKIRTRPLPNY